MLRNWNEKLSCQNQCYFKHFEYRFSIQIFDTNGRLLYQFGTRGKADGEIWYPAGVCLDKSGNIFVADHGNHRIQVRFVFYHSTLSSVIFLSFF